MQTNIHGKFRQVPGIDEADAILRSCVHCGFCNATCPTYLELNDERDGPRGRIYLIKQLLEGEDVSSRTQTHLDRCLTCRNCETTCPSGVQYGKLIDFGRGLVEQRVQRPWRERCVRWLLEHVVAYRKRFSVVVALGRIFRPLLPAALRAKIPARQAALARPTRAHARVMLALQGCAQAAATPNTNAAAARILDRLGIQLIGAERAGCCGALSYHLGNHTNGLTFMKRNIDAWWPAIEQGAEAIVLTASGCGVTVKDYGHLLKDDDAYRSKAARVSELAKDISEILVAEDLSTLASQRTGQRIAFHCPCTLQHGQQLGGTVERILRAAGFTLSAVKDPHLCCGSAGSYSILQADMSRKLRAKKLAALTADSPDLIVTANVGCQLQLDDERGTRVAHWLELLA
jgi:glycolate oxidase iron-sulfur subunit